MRRSSCWTSCSLLNSFFWQRHAWQVKEKGNDIKKTLADITADTKLLKRQIVETASEGKEVFQELKDDMHDTLSNWKQDISQNKRHIEKEILDIQKSIEKLQEAVPEKA